MRLKKLTLQGYKTFATKTDFVFDNGITAIVGPNGSGKSNIADALRWVLGEQSYSTLRGKRTMDMIFAGSQTRSRAGMAQAILTLDNREGWLPIAYSELEIGRRAFRTGDNEYLLNGQRVRLRDITELLASSGLAERTYTIIGQGLIDQALSLRPEERRALFEEAAGVTHYKHQRAEALRRLEETQRNLERVNDILAELSPRLGYLRRQASRAQNYEQVAADLRHQLRIYYGFQWQRARDQLRAARQEDQATQAAWQATRKSLLEQQQKLDEARERASKLQDILGTAHAEREAWRDQVEQHRRQAAVAQEHQKLVQRQLADLEGELPELVRQQAQARAELEEALAALEVARSQLADRENELNAFKLKFEAGQAELASRKRVIEELELQRENIEAQTSRQQGHINHLTEQIQRLKSEAKLQDDLGKAAEAVEVARQSLTECDSRLEHLRQRDARLRASGVEAKQSLERLRAQLQHLDAEGVKLTQRITELTTKRDLLSRQAAEGTAVPEGVDLVGRLAELMEVPAPYQRALESVLAARINTWLVRDGRSLWELLGANPDTHISAALRSDLRSPEVHGEINLPGVVGWAEGLVEVEPEALPLAKALMGSVLIVEEPEQAYEAALQLPIGALAVSLTGLVASPQGIVESPPRLDEQGILTREQEWRQTIAELAHVSAEMAQLEERVQAQRAVLAGAERAQEELSRQSAALAEELHSTNLQRSERQRTLDRLEQSLAHLAGQQEARLAEVAQAERRLSELQQELKSLEKIGDAARKELALARSAIETLPAAEAPRAVQQLKAQHEAARTILAGRQAVVDSRRATMAQIDDRLSRLNQRQEQYWRELQALHLEEISEGLASMEVALEAVDERVRPLSKELVHARNESEEIERGLGRLQRQGHELETHYTESRIALNQRENQMEALRERIRSDLGLVALEYDEEEASQAPLPISEVVDQLPEVDELPADIEASIQEYRGRLTRMGSINPEAPAEYQETQDRYDFLEGQVDDLVETLDRLKTVIEELDELTSQAFAATVEEVNLVFGEVFERLFGGGSAQLVLTEPDDLTISGVDIVARLPRQREQGLALLSGGERSLTASALIFALLKVAPTPFCVLDEVDAMLDEANVTRFRELLKELSTQTQFVVITHNRGTVQVARTVYGVSMGDDSASQVISIRPEEYLSRQSQH
jgi:chromosome segregation protein